VKLVADANTLISGTLWEGPSARLISAALQGDVQIFLSLPILLEFREVLQRAKFAHRLAARGETADSLMKRFRVACHEAIPAQIASPPELRDPEDLHILACALGANADIIVTGDKGLLVMKSFLGIPILTAVQALTRLGLS
jgi:putative PIN family toxin of toxin-antitoxin system